MLEQIKYPQIIFFNVENRNLSDFKSKIATAYSRTDGSDGHGPLTHGSLALSLIERLCTQIKVID